MNARTRMTGVSLFFAIAAVACSSATSRSSFDSTKSGTDPGDGGAGGSEGTFTPGSDGGVDSANCADIQANGDPNKDYDGDGYALKDDCNECDVNANKGAFDVPGNGVDEDCNGTPDDEVTDCDADLDIAGDDPFDGARAIGLCKKATDKLMWGVISAKWTKADGKAAQPEPLSEGILGAFGVNSPQAGQRMLAISSGSAREPGDPDYHNVSGWQKGGFMGISTGTPDGYPKDSPSCGGSMGSFGSSYDGAALVVKVRVPSNAKSFKYQQNFFTYEFPQFICSNYNDFFVTMMDPAPSNLDDGNIAFDQDGNPISVNNSFLQVCQPRTAGGKKFDCPLGDAALEGTGFEGHAASGWLTTTAPVEEVRGQEITLVWSIWDQGDGSLDSTALIDDFSWSLDEAGAATKPTPVN